jgi:hypothetical protein
MKDRIGFEINAKGFCCWKVLIIGSLAKLHLHIKLTGLLPSDAFGRMRDDGFKRRDTPYAKGRKKKR